MARTRSNTRAAVTHDSKRTAATVAADRLRKAADQAEWEDMAGDTEAIPDLDGLTERPAANMNSESEARRRIEMLREERQLQQALSDVFEL